jgi:nitronate monooxygenase
VKATGWLARLGAEIPIVAAPMSGGSSTPALVLAAAEAGGLGFLAAGYKTVDEIVGQVAEVRRTTDRFGVNVFAPNPVPIAPAAFNRYASALGDRAARYGIDLGGVAPSNDDDQWGAKVEALIDDPVPVVSFTFGLPPAGVVSRLRRAGSLTMQTVTNADEARQAAARGVDALVVQGHAAGGHSGIFTVDTPIGNIPLPALVEDVRRAVPLPILAAGGLATAADIREVLAAGAEACAVGTILLRSRESGASSTHKQALGDPARTEAVLTKAFSGRPARALRNDFVDVFDPIAPAGYPALHHLTIPIRQAAAAAGDPENINIWAGAGYRSATDEPAAVILRRLGAD